MKEKIKNFFGFIGRAWSDGIYGKFGIVMLVFALFIFVRMFWGDVNVQKLIINVWRLHGEQEQLAAEQEKLQKIQRHIELLQGYSADYVEELGLKYLNIGDAKYKILKI
ncbi:MAG TPA: hypothetical protein IAD02_03820 [Candidatus Enterousia intestinigallinarum]|uniref:Uncharacterized protein n=1 Tax=Candidatus Enterousia intestinigallinarum TaxID=2840790 RepID=A0A9D1FH91_9PROT|nr:hypothetical protein [Candidatus Enterousia intestinigallinarum]